MSITISNISKKFKNFKALDDVSLNIEPGELVALIGPSGSGKTTLLRIISGLENPDLGCVYISGEDITVKSLRERKIGFVFQHYALFRHMTVFDNVAFGLTVLPKEVRPSKEFIADKVHKLLQLVHIEQLADRYPSQLSGGQRQRVALARSLAVEPKILLLDEPFGALDSKVRKELRRWLRRLHDDFSVTTIFVTHDQEEAMEVADKVVVMNAGKIEQIGTPEEVYHHPANAFVYDFLGNYNVFTGAKNENGEVNITQYKSKTSVNKKLMNKAKPWFSKIPFVGKLFAPMKEEESVFQVEQTSIDDDLIQIFARPHDMEIFTKPEAGKFIPVKLVHINPAGPLIKLEMETEDGAIIQAEVTKDLFETLKLKKGDSLFTRPKETKIFE